MNPMDPKSAHVAIACGGTGGHLFPGIAVGNEVLARGGRVTLFISEKEVDRQAVRDLQGMKIVALPSVGLMRGRLFAFIAGVLNSRRHALFAYQGDAPDVVLAMGGFTSAGPVLAGRKVKAACFLHDSNVIPGRANRWLARFASEVFVAFPEAQARFRKPTRITGTPVRSEFYATDQAAARVALGLRLEDPVLLVMGGSQGASAINRLMQEALPKLVEKMPLLQFIHLTGATDLDAIQTTYQKLGVNALVQVFCGEMHNALGAATLAVSRAGGSSLAEIAATGTPSLLIPFPHAAENHQYFNALAMNQDGAAIMLDQNKVSGADFASLVIDLIRQQRSLQSIRHRLLLGWRNADAASRIVDAMCAHRPFVSVTQIAAQSTRVEEASGASPFKPAESSVS